MQNKVSAFYKYTFQTCTMDPTMNETLICLIPKCLNVCHIKNFRLIGLCNTLYKLITKIIIHRIKPLLPNIISPSEASFLQNRKLSDNAIIIQEFITHINKIRGKKRNMIIKINLYKIFDRLKWSFIRDSFNYFQFPIHWPSTLCTVYL